MNGQIRKVGLVLVLCFMALFAQLNWLQVYGADRLEENPNNTRAIIRDFGRERGIIATADGVVVARTLEVDDD
ncbi:MAG: penicillin-binding protein 2, partial [Acidimicrobiia bacterium]|nr:penicillin-binding protein 2 [Acidimicrobiia bacterium]